MATEDSCSVVLASFRLNGNAQRLHLGRVVEDKEPPAYGACVLALWRVKDTQSPVLAYAAPFLLLLGIIAGLSL